MARLSTGTRPIYSLKPNYSYAQSRFIQERFHLSHVRQTDNLAEAKSGPEARSGMAVTERQDRMRQ